MTREEAIERIKARFDKWALDDKDMKAIQTLIPEFSESVEDERIREELVEYHKQQFEKNRDQEVGLFHKDALAWLEKQKDASKAIEAVDRIDKYIDEHLANAHDMKDSNPDKKYYRGWDDALGEMAGILQDVYSGEKQEEQKPLFKQISDSVIWDSGLRTGIELGKKEQKPIKWTDLTWKDIVELEGIINNVHYDFSAGIGQESFGKEVLERFRSTKGIEYLDEAEQKCWREEEQKPEWSEEDKEMLECVIMDVESAKENYLKSTTEVVRQGAIIADKELAWLKSLRPSWKPSEEQMKALKECGECKRFIKKLYEDLKKRYGTC